VQALFVVDYVVMWQLDEITPDRVVEVTADLSVREACMGWRSDSEFRQSFIDFLAGVRYEAFYWETPAMTQDQWDETFRFVVVDGPNLARLKANPAPFRARFRDEQEAWSIAFPNLGGDAQLVVPTPRAEPSVYAHLAAFCRGAPMKQQHTLWQQVGAVYARTVGRKPIWLSTAGLGVAWLHIRLDRRPKYYRHGPYRRQGT